MKHSIQIMGARAIAVLLCAGVLLTLAGCGGKDGHSSASASAPAPSTSTPAQSSTGQPAQTLTLYYGDQNAEYLLSKTVDVPEITPAAILSALQDAGVVDKAVTIEKSQLDGDAISVDCSAAFQTSRAPLANVSWWAAWSTRSSPLTAQKSSPSPPVARPWRATWTTRSR